jgi:hypothetical protein
MTCDVDTYFECNFLMLQINPATCLEEVSEEHLAKTMLFEVEDLQKDRNESIVFIQQHEWSSYYLSKREQR